MTKKTLVIGFKILYTICVFNMCVLAGYCGNKTTFILLP